ncbi:MAG: hypothetical protein JNN27_09050 [Planctomycetes bacterium]|nr:hypothetical protein [Planctomycetota bacterium]
MSMMLSPIMDAAKRKPWLRFQLILLLPTAVHPSQRVDPAPLVAAVRKRMPQAPEDLALTQSAEWISLFSAGEAALVGSFDGATISWTMPMAGAYQPELIAPVLAAHFLDRSKLSEGLEITKLLLDRRIKSGSAERNAAEMRRDEFLRGLPNASISPVEKLPDLNEWEWQGAAPQAPMASGQTVIFVWSPAVCYPCVGPWATAATAASRDSNLRVFALCLSTPAEFDKYRVSNPDYQMTTGLPKTVHAAEPYSRMAQPTILGYSEQGVLDWQAATSDPDLTHALISAYSGGVAGDKIRELVSTYLAGGAGLDKRAAFELIEKLRSLEGQPSESGAELSSRIETARAKLKQIQQVSLEQERLAKAWELDQRAVSVLDGRTMFGTLEAWVSRTRKAFAQKGTHVSQAMNSELVTLALKLKEIDAIASRGMLFEAQSKLEECEHDLAATKPSAYYCPSLSLEGCILVLGSWVRIASTDEALYGANRASAISNLEIAVTQLDRMIPGMESGVTLPSLFGSSGRGVPAEDSARLRELTLWLDSETRRLLKGLREGDIETCESILTQMRASICGPVGGREAVGVPVSPNQTSDRKALDVLDAKWNVCEIELARAEDAAKAAEQQASKTMKVRNRDQASARLAFWGAIASARRAVEGHAKHLSDTQFSLEEALRQGNEAMVPALRRQIEELEQKLATSRWLKRSELPTIKVSDWAEIYLKLDVNEIPEYPEQTREMIVEGKAASLSAARTALLNRQSEIKGTLDGRFRMKPGTTSDALRDESLYLDAHLAVIEQLLAVCKVNSLFELQSIADEALRSFYGLDLRR